MNSKQILSVSLGATLLLSATATSVYWFIFKGPVEATDRAGDIVVDKTEQMLRLAKKVIDVVEEKTGIRSSGFFGGETIILSKQQIAEIAVVRKDLIEGFTWEHSYLGSTKKLEIRGEFAAKAGYRLTSPMELRFDSAGGSVTMVLPEPELLSNEMTGYRVIVDEDGWWNSLSAKDQEMAISALQKRARDKVIESGILKEADDEMLKHLRLAVEGVSKTPFEIKRENRPLP